MDFWLVAAAAGAGYVAKYWQNISRDRNNSLQLSYGDKDFKKPEFPVCPLWSLKHRTKLRGNVAKDGTFDKTLPDISPFDDASGAELASTSGNSKKLKSLGSYQDFDVLSVSNLPPGILGNENLKEHERGNRLNGNLSDNCSDSSPKPSNGEMDCFDGLMRNRSSLRSKRYQGQFVKPMNSLESCLMAQLYKERAQMEEYVLSSLPSPSTPTMRTLCVTDGSRVISSAYNDSFSAQTGTKACLQKNEKVYGVPLLPKIGSLSPAKKMKAKTRKGRNGKLCSSCKFINGKDFHSQGALDGTVLFCLGISIGIISSFVTNKSEVDKLKSLLKQTEYLVQDLQEELEMKDSLTVKELANENYESQDTCDNSIAERVLNTVSSEHNIDSSTRYDDRGSYLQKAEESSESMSKIEAELEAELERLGLDMNATTLQRRLSDVVELDPDFVADFAQGELRVDMLGGQAVAKCKLNEDGASTSTTHHSGNYAVSPRELSLRLHEIIQSRLEERVNELETALQNSQRKIRMIESEHKNWGELSNGRLRYPSMQESPFTREGCYSISQPLVMNLSGEALDAYNEAHEELMKMSESDEEDSPHRVYENLHYSQSLSHTKFENQNCERMGSMEHSAIAEEKPLGEFFQNNLRIEEEHISLVLGSNETSDFQEEIGDFDDEIEKQLIKQIVERTKKGSPVILNAQKLLFSIDEQDH